MFPILMSFYTNNNTKFNIRRISYTNNLTIL
nr:MAG TPA: hypothetical protein [Bacteriophage sp.]